MKLKCIIVDDESLARKLIEENVRQLPFLELTGVCKNPFEAMDILQTQQVDLIFLDIQMPGMLGTKFLQGIRDKPMVIFITAYSNYAVESYDLEVIDYLMKPVSLERFTKASYKALEEKQKRDALLQSNNATEARNIHEEFFFVNADYSLVKIIINNISHIESMKDYVKIYLTTSLKPVITKSTLKALEEKLSFGNFIRVHKSFLVNVDKIESIRSQNIVIGSHNIPVSDANVESLMRALNQMK